MPYAVTHFLVPAILVAIFRDFYLRKKDKKKFPLHYVLIAGLAGLLMDLDYILYYALQGFNFSFPSHRIFFHNVFFIFIFFILGFIFMRTKIGVLGKHKLKLSTIFFVISFGGFIHLILDATLIGTVLVFYPFSELSVGINLLKKFPEYMHNSISEIIDTILLVFWMIYLQVKHRISDYI